MTNAKKDAVQNQQKINPLAAAATGVVVGAGIGIVGVIAMQDKKNRAKVKEVFVNAKDQAMSYMEDIKHTVNKKRKGEVNKNLAY